MTAAPFTPAPPVVLLRTAIEAHAAGMGADEDRWSDEGGSDPTERVRMSRAPSSPPAPRAPSSTADLEVSPS
jgi:hypothetical protein